jgi:hypothetical protein
MSSGSSIPAFLEKFHAQLVARFAAADLGPIVVYLTTAGDESLDDGVLLVRDAILGDQIYRVLGAGGARDEDVVIPGFVQAYAASGNGDGSAMQAAFDRAGAIIDEVIAELRDNTPQVGEQTVWARLDAVRWLPAPSDAGGWRVRAEYDLSYSARVP